MPEGHTLHRAADEQRPHFAGRRPTASSPQGRFAEGAASIDGALCRDVEAFGKHLLYPFEGPEGEDRHLHIHLGLFGRIRQHRGELPEPRGLVRVRLAVPGYAVDISGPTACEVLDEAERARLLARLGPDPLRDDAKPAKAWAKIAKSRTAIGTLLMDQSVVAGIGNIYRAEFLWLARVHPKLPGKDLPKRKWNAIWADAVKWMRIGVETGLIITTEGPTPKSRRSRRRFNIYKRAECPRCGTPTTTFMLAARKVYCCEVCAPPPEAS